MKQYSCAAVTKTGRRRNNQDNFCLDGAGAPLNHTTERSVTSKEDEPFVALVADGMGGEERGEYASYLASQRFCRVSLRSGAKRAENARQIHEAILNSNADICSEMRSSGSKRMGSTVVSALIQDGVLNYTNLGDSRLYLLRKGRLTQLTEDHTEAQLMLNAGVLTKEQLKNHPSSNKLSRHLGIFPEELQLDIPHYDEITLKDGDTLLLCSDGVWGVLSEPEIARILSTAGEAKDCAEALTDAAFSAGSRDNMTALVIQVRETAAAAGGKSKRRGLILCLIDGALVAALIVAVICLIGRGKGVFKPTEPTASPMAAPTQEPTAEPTEAPTGPPPGAPPGGPPPTARPPAG
ncbi:MAG: protein phosphatase 2C domain-containing protein, partial [Clostridia bacterium]|nr:protein phosphatase 2C domain-containing protein [Clostridia bacterium]